ncbi:putative mitochondrial membrane [Chlorella sorokiniana]|uniref:Mitochondrial membrane n=1 Tax=Chlorella sorokiniana TaxID=3076 RepID=A0A2P6TNT2_CHLSO|nr:putative mitochondrial membrane [Chlorella sorokiniana]|eukprot:PRW50997.1 putative mitochondrial membrane [Chlorella sorokiniana]
MAPFPLCCLAGAASGDAAAAAAALSMGLATGAAMHWLYTAGPELRDESSSLEAVVAEHRRTSERTDRCNGPLVLVGACGAATAAVAARGTRAAAPLALSAALNLGLIAFTLGVVGPLQRTIYASAGNKSDQGATRAALRRWAGLHKARIVVSLASCGAAVCGVLLWNKKSA